MGPKPDLPPPRKTVIPTVKIAPATGWSEGQKPTAAAGLQVNAFATGLDHPRWLYVLPNGDVLVAETNAPERPEDARGIKGAVMKSAMKKAGAAVPSANRITLLRDANSDGAVVPDYALGSHTASLGLAFYTARLFPQKYAGGAFVGQHGSWNRDPPSGYKVIFIPFAAGKPDGKAEDVLTGFLDEKGNARGRPVGVVVDSTGALLVADDVGNTVWRVTPASTSTGSLSPP